jgi:hypothetical protein
MKRAKVRASEAGTGGIQDPGNSDVPKQRETSTETLKRLRSEDSSPTETATFPKRPRYSSGPRTYRAYKEALANMKIAYFWE